jgi:type IV pilus assembly protein PilN
MIRINLLAADKPSPKVIPFARYGAGPHNLTIGCAVILIAAVALIGWRYWQIQKQSDELNVQIGQAQAETVRLRSVLLEVQRFEQQRTQLQQRVGLIEQLRKEQTGPVHMLDEISRAIPPTLWLTDLKQAVTGAEVTIEGKSTVLTGLTDFVSNLEKSGYFKKSVEIVNTQLEASPTAGEVIKFSIKAQFSRPAVAAGDAARTTTKPAN